MINAKDILASAEKIAPAILSDRRKIHENPETGACLPKTKEFVSTRLREMGYEPKEICESGITAEITGEDTGRCILLRADMDGLKIAETTGLEFASANGNMHACGHDIHTAMLLGAAAVLREYQSRIKGTVKLVFQPDEEGFTGAKAMLNAGVLENPAPQAGFALHVNSGTPSGMLICGRGRFMAGCTIFRIIVKGVGCHGAMPENGVDPVNIAAHIYLAIQEITAREIQAKTPAVITIGKFSAGKAPNIIPEDAVLEGTIRTFDSAVTDMIMERIEKIAKSTAEAFRGEAFVESPASAPPLHNDPGLVDEMAGYAAELFGKEKIFVTDSGGMGSEDFSSYTYRLPCAYLLIGAGVKEENPLFGMPMHNEKTVFNEKILPYGAALHAYCGMKWLEK